jgi:hypothetical protein
MAPRFLLPTLLLAVLAARGETTVVPIPVDDPDSSITPGTPNIQPSGTADLTKPEGVQWKPLLIQALRFLVVEDAFRYATEAQTRHPGEPYFAGYINSITNLHGWADGDPFLVNYVGHPIQGAVSGFIWVRNDRRYRGVEFGRNRDYWRSRLRAMAFSWAYSIQTEIGPVLSEASIGAIQSRYPQQGFVDHVITPTVGFGWMVTEDFMDRYVIRYLEQKTKNRYYRAVFRGTLNPSRTFANAMAGQLPWARARDEWGSIDNSPKRPAPRYEAQPPPGVAPFEVRFNSLWLQGTGGPCIGGGATAAIRIGAQWQIVGDVNGCNMNGLPANLSGDFLEFMAGARWTPMVSGRWHPYVQALGGGVSNTQELMNPAQEAILDTKAKKTNSSQFHTAGPALAAGGGLDFQINRALAFQVLNAEYTRAWVKDLPGFAAPDDIQIKTGLVLRMGTW